MAEDIDAKRLEDLWAGPFGDAYLDRNRGAGSGREPFWQNLLHEFPADTVLEVGCGSGANLQWIVPRCRAAWGVDISPAALEALARAVPEATGTLAEARSLPFGDRSFDLAFTAGVLIHQPETSVEQVVQEIVRVSRRYVLALEYDAPSTEVIPYHGQTDALFRRDYEALFRRLFPDLHLLRHGFLPRSSGWDDVTWWLFEKPGLTGTAGS